MIPVEKPGSPEEALAHFGKKGMKWGVTTTTTSSRDRSREFAKKYPTGKVRAAAIRRARAQNEVRRVAFQTETNKAKKVELKKAFLKHPDRVTALRLTRGEKIVEGIVAGVLPVVGTAVIGGALAGQVKARHVIEKKQARGAYG